MLKDTCTFTNIVGTGSSTDAGQPSDTVSLTIGYRKEEGIKVAIYSLIVSNTVLRNKLVKLGPQFSDACDYKFDTVAVPII